MTQTTGDMHRQALKVAFIYAAFSLLWILFSDRLLLMITTDSEVLADLQSLKGGLFVLISALFLYLLVLRSLRRQSRAEHSLLESERRFRAIFNGVNDAIFLHDAENGEILDVNRQAEAYYGYHRAELRALSISALSSNQPPYTQEAALHWIELARAGQTPTYEWQARHRDGRLFWVEVSMCSAELPDQPVILVTVRNIEKRKQAEAALQESKARYRALAELSPDGILVNAGDRLAYANPAAVKLLGASTEELLLERSPFDFIAPQEHAQVRRRIADLLRQGGHMPIIPQHWQQLDGSSVQVEVSASRISWQGQPAIQVLLRDITARLRMEEQLRQSQKMEALGILAGGIAHDFNNLLAIIIGNIEMARHKLPAESKLTRNIALIQDASLRATGLIKQILTFSRMGTMEQELVCLAAVIGESLKMLRSTLPASVLIRSDLSEAAQTLCIRGNVTQLQQVLLNLCSNAVQAMAEEGELGIALQPVTLTARDLPASSSCAAGNYLCLQVSDTGSGMSAPTVEKIFDPFFTTKQVGQGTGLGLAVVHGIIESHQGFIQVDSAPGEGSRFSLYFPRCEEPIEPPKSAVPASLLLTGQEHILLVDDEPTLRESFQEILQTQGYRVTATTSSQDALERFVAAPEGFDLLITDQTMPDLTGAELARQCLQIRDDLPVILLSGYTAMITAAQARELGIHTFHLKPLTRQELTHLVHEALQERAPAQADL